jgi:tetratricopeptide (TPR) repeat protein
MENPDAPVPNPKIAEALAFLQAAEQSAGSGDPSRAAWTIQQFDEGISRLRPLVSGGGDPLRWLALALMGRANIQRTQRGEAGLTDALRSYDEAIAVLKSTTATGASEDVRRDDLANVWINRGLTLLASGSPEQLTEAIKNFDACIELRKTLPAGENHHFHYGLSAGWMNRADALTRLSTPESLAEALLSYDAALAVMQTLPIDENDWFRHRLAVAWMNRGITAQAIGGEASVTEALKGFDQAIELLKGHRVLERPEGKHLLACAWLNRAGLLLATAPDKLAEARAAALEARDTIAGMEEQQPGLADVALKARHALCRAASARLAEAKPDEDLRELVGEATDAVDEGLALTRLWEERGVGAFKGVEAELFHFGAQMYEKHQPQFLAEFVLENLDPERSAAAARASAPMMQAGFEVVSRTLQSLQSRGFGELGKPGMERLLETLGDLRAASERLRVLRSRIRA